MQHFLNNFLCTVPGTSEGSAPLTFSTACRLGDWLKNPSWSEAGRTSYCLLIYPFPIPILHLLVAFGSVESPIFLYPVFLGFQDTSLSMASSYFSEHPVCFPMGPTQASFVRVVCMFDIYSL